MKQRMWSPISASLIYGKRDAILVDTFFTVNQADALVDWIAASGKNLTTIYITHGHGDHLFGIGAATLFLSGRTTGGPFVSLHGITTLNTS
jgi:glyoxylase-like metal-dependent hydrolase (beta-lactamase superfamily II)